MTLLKNIYNIDYSFNFLIAICKLFFKFLEIFCLIGFFGDNYFAHLKDSIISLVIDSD